jgi:hypothetical protein
VKNDTFVSIVTASEAIGPFIDVNQQPSGTLPSSVRNTPNLSVRTNSASNLLAYNTTISLRNCENLQTTQPRSTLDVLIRITDIILLIGAVIVAISLCITFSTVGLAVYRMCFSNVIKINVTQIHMMNLKD